MPLENEDPKKKAGDLKDPLHLLPTVALRFMARVLKGGADKYGVYNWRFSKGVKIMTYAAAILRHLFLYMDGEGDVGVRIHHLYPVDVREQPRIGRAPGKREKRSRRHKYRRDDHVNCQGHKGLLCLGYYGAMGLCSQAHCRIAYRV